jgi:hypothetical protein
MDGKLSGARYHQDMKTAATRPTDPSEGEPARARRKREALAIKDWRKAKTRLEDTPLAREAWALGEAYRKSQTSP